MIPYISAALIAIVVIGMVSLWMRRDNEQKTNESAASKATTGEDNLTVNDWHQFLTERNGSSCSIVTGTQVSDEVKRIYPHLVALKIIPTENDYESDFPHGPHFEKYYEIEDIIKENISSELQVFSGRITNTQHHTVKYYYTTQAGVFDGLIESLREQFDEFDFDLAQQPDPEWKVFQEMLYPTEAEWQGIADQSVLENLKSHGDDLTQPRMIGHYIYFEREADLDQVASMLKEDGYEIVSKNNPSDDIELWGLSFRRVDHVGNGQITQVSVKLMNLVKQYNGEYDGWGCNVITGESS